MRTRIILILALFLATLVRAQDEQMPAAPPIVEPQMFMLMRIDLNQVNFNLISKWLAAQPTTSPSSQQAQLQRIMQQQFKQMNLWRDSMVQAGGSMIYITFSMADVPNVEPITYVPLGPDAQPDVVATLMNSGNTNGPAPLDVEKAAPGARAVGKVPGGILFGRTENVKRLQARAATNPAAPELSKALVDAGPGVIQVVYVPNTELSDEMDKAMPKLPPPINSPMTALSRGVKSAVLTFQPPPGPSAKIVINAQDAQTAAQIKAMGDLGLNFFQTPMFQQPLGAADVKAMVAALSPQVQGNQVTVQAADANLRELLTGLMLMAFRNAPQQQQQMTGMTSERQYLMGIVIYAEGHQGALPNNLGLVSQYVNGGRPLQVRGKSGDDAFTYHKPADKMSQVKNPAQTIMLWENLANVPANMQTVAVGFVDGHVEGWPRQRLITELAAMGIATTQPATQPK